MKPLNFNYLNDTSEETRELVKKCSTSPHFCNHVTLPSSSFSPTGSDFLTVVSAKKGKMNGMTVIRLRVLTYSGGITVTVPYEDELVYLRYRSMCGYLKNQKVQITFPSITVNCSARGYGLYFTSTDFKMKSLDAPAEPTIYI